MDVLLFDAGFTALDGQTRLLVPVSLLLTDDKEHTVDTDRLSSTTVNDECGPCLQPDPLAIGIEEPVVAAKRFTFLKHLIPALDNGFYVVMVEEMKRLLANQVILFVAQ